MYVQNNFKQNSKLPAGKTNKGLEKNRQLIEAVSKWFNNSEHRDSIQAGSRIVSAADPTKRNDDQNFLLNLTLTERQIYLRP